MALVMLMIQLILLRPVMASVAKPGCQEKCGNITVPYPFGLDYPDCYREGYDLTCNHTFNPPKLFISTSNLEILEISPSLTQLRIYGFMGHDCYNRSGSKTESWYYWVNIDNLPYTFSDTHNRFTTIGCDTLSQITGSEGRNFTSGCYMACSDKESVINGSCTGIGCCQTSIPKGFKKFNVNVWSYENHTSVWNFNPCSYAFLVDYDWYRFSVDDLSHFYERYGDRLPLVLDWAIENETCETVSRIYPSYACGKNSDCYNSPNGLGYLCNCSQGYQGNPYLEDGCQDINECEDQNKNDCQGICHNTPGGYYCSCPPGTKRDGTKNGSLCIASPTKFPVIQTAVGNKFNAS